MTEPSTTSQFPSVLSFLFEPHPFKVPYGGRAGLKTVNIAAALVILGAATSVRVLCAREVQNSIKDSVHQELKDAIERNGLGWYYKITDHEISSRRNGTVFIFRGLRANVNEIKSMAGINICWVEEAEKVSKASWEALLPTLRTMWLMPLNFYPPGTQFTQQEIYQGGRWVDPEFWVSFNPADEDDETYRMFVSGTPPPGSVVIKTSWRDADALGWFPENLRKQKDHLAETDYDAYLHVWEGEPRKVSAAQVLRGKYIKQWFEVPDEGTPEREEWDGPYFGTDFGFSVSPHATVKCWVHRRRLYVEHEAGGVQNGGLKVETDNVPALIETIPGSKEHVNRADCARPETISYCRRHGHPLMIPCQKGPGSVEDGVSYLRGEFEQIVVHPRCPGTLDDCRLYSYEIDKNTQEVLPKLQKGHDDFIDAIRYAIEPLIRGKVKLPGAWWRRWSSLAEVEARTTIKYVTMTVDEVTEGAAEMRAVFQLWAVGGLGSMSLVEEAGSFGLLPVLLDEAQEFWGRVSVHAFKHVGATELWCASKSVGKTLVDALRSRGMPAREFEPEDPLVNDSSWRAKQASVHLASGRVFVPPGPCLVKEEAEGLATDAMSLALIIWQRRGGGQGEVA